MDPAAPEASAVTVSRSTDHMTPAAAETWVQARPLGFSTLEKEQFGPYWSSGMYLIQSDEDWADCMTKLAQAGTLLQDPAPEAPDVDWRREAVVLITLGVRPTTCFDVEIHGVRRHGTTLLVDVTRARPMLGGRYCYQTYITPYHLVRVDRQGKLKYIAEI